MPNETFVMPIPGLDTGATGPHPRDAFPRSVVDGVDDGARARAGAGAAAQPGSRGAGRTDSASFSRESLAALQAEGDEETPGAAAERSATGEPLTPEEEEQVRELRARDREVRAHEQAHKAVAGDLATGGPTYSYQRGPDGVDYAVGGEVGIALRRGDTPEQTLSNAQRAQRAALAPAEPSAQDRAVASEAAQMAAEARSEIAAERAAERRGEEPDEATASIPGGGSAPVGGSAGTTASGAVDAAGGLLDLFA